MYSLQECRHGYREEMSKLRFALLALALAILAAATSGTAAARSSCSTRLIADWQDGRIDRTYPVPCYRQALARLPEDVRVYSTATSDITRALHARLASSGRRSAAASTAGGGGGSGTTTLVVLAIAGVLLVAAGSFSLARR
jgi:hypothetical protein